MSSFFTRLKAGLARTAQQIRERLGEPGAPDSDDQIGQPGTGGAGSTPAARPGEAGFGAVKAKRAVASLSGHGHAAFPVDVTEEASIVRLFSAVEDSLGPVAVLVCIAGGRIMTAGPGAVARCQHCSGIDVAIADSIGVLR